MSESENRPGLSLAAQVESLLFVAVEPVSPGQLATALEATSVEVNEALDELDSALRTRGLRLQRH
ncbi:MAG: SMC-Scp complex subunit ScpB, partial [Anaerolineales bacterium]|nr:SMC-Scp complex subunit ScpB [Anaerolineales bacterium]